MVRSPKTGIRFPAENCLRIATAALFTWTTAGYPAFAQTPPPPPAQQAPPADQSDQGYSMSDLEYILGPIALYPDPLLALIFPASAFPDQLTEAKNWIAANPQAVANNDFSGVDSMPWDPSVQALTRFPDVIDMLTEKPEWTASIAWAFSVQHEDVSAAIQLLRAKAKDVGNLQSTPQQVVTTQPSGGSGPPVIYIAPADPERIYVPVYDPGIVFGTAVAGALFFGTAFFVGSYWNNRWGWNNRTWNSVWIAPPHGWRPYPGPPGRPPHWRPDNRPDWRPNRPPGGRPDRPHFRPDGPGGNRPGGPGGPGFRPDRPGGPGGRPDRPNLGPGGRPGGRPELPSTRPGRPDFRPDRPGGGNRPGAGRPDGGRPNTRPEGRPSRPGGGQRPGASRPDFNRPATREARPQHSRPQARPQQRQARPQARPQPRPQARPHGGGGGRPHGGGGGRGGGDGRRDRR